MLWSMARLRGYGLHARDGAIGQVVTLFFDDAAWVVRYLVVDTGGWLFGRQVLIPPHVLGDIDRDAREIRVHLSREQVRNSPDVDTDKPVGRQEEGAIYGYYGWEPYWGAPGIAAAPGLGAVAPHGPDDVLPHRASGDPHLRSAKEVAGYRVHCQDQVIGHIDDVVIDDDGWHLRYFIIDTGSWLPGRKVPLPPEWVQAISWADHEILVPLSAEAIRSSPQYTDERAIDRAFEERLFAHYGRPVYW